MLTIRLPDEIEVPLQALSERTGRSKDDYVREAVLEHLDDLGDYYLAEQRLKETLPTIPLEGVERCLGVADQLLNPTSEDRASTSYPSNNARAGHLQRLAAPVVAIIS